MMTAGRVTNLYDLMDSAYDAKEIHQTSERLGHVPIIDVNPRRDKELKEELDRRPGPDVRRAMSTRERAFPDPFRCREDQRPPQGRVRRAPCPRPGHAKVACHLMFGILALTVDQLIRLAAP